MKKVIRKDMKQKLLDLSRRRGFEWLTEQSERASQRIIGTDAYQQAKCVSVFLSMPHEVQTRSLLADILARGKRCFVPFIKDSTMQMVELQSLEILDSLPRDKWGIPGFEALSPSQAVAKPGEIDLIIVPGLAFDRQQMGRIGYGKGYYDRYFESHQPKQKFALMLDEQILPVPVPQEEHDVSLDFLFTPSSRYCKDDC